MHEHTCLGAPAPAPAHYRAFATAVIVALLSLSLAADAFAQRRDENDKPSGTYLGTLSVSPWVPDSIANLFGRDTSRRVPDRETNPGGWNPLSWFGPSAKVYSRGGKYLGKLNANPYDPDSIANPYGRYGNPYSPDSVNNPYGRYGSRYGAESANNPYATRLPRIYSDDGR